jgi:hypothetical protein
MASGKTVVVTTKTARRLAYEVKHSSWSSKYIVYPLSRFLHRRLARIGKARSFDDAMAIIRASVNEQIIHIDIRGR